MRHRLVATAVALLVFGFSPTAIGAKHEIIDGQVGRDLRLALRTSSAVPDALIPIRFLRRNTPGGAFSAGGLKPTGVHGVLGSQGPPVTPGSGLNLILVGFTLVGGAIFLRRMTPG